jgi:hypothetical protein
MARPSSAEPRPECAPWSRFAQSDVEVARASRRGSLRQQPQLAIAITASTNAMPTAAPKFSLIGSQGHDRVTEGPAARLRNVPYRASNTFGRVHGL